MLSWFDSRTPIFAASGICGWFVSDVSENSDFVPQVSTGWLAGHVPEGLVALLDIDLQEAMLGCQYLSRFTHILRAQSRHFELKSDPSWNKVLSNWSRHVFDARITVFSMLFGPNCGSWLAWRFVAVWPAVTRKSSSYSHSKDTVNGQFEGNLCQDRKAFDGQLAVEWPLHVLQRIVT